MSGDLTARDVIARTIGGPLPDGGTGWAGKKADAVLAALDAAGWRLERDNQWEWGLFSSAHDGVVIEDDDHQRFTEETARASANAHWRVVHRYSAGEWEPA